MNVFVNKRWESILPVVSVCGTYICFRLFHIRMLQRQMPFRLDLENFEEDFGRESPYVLTSPTSLHACHVLNIKVKFEFVTIN